MNGRPLSKFIELIKRSPAHWELVLNRPEKYNALTTDMYDSITDVVNAAAKDEDLVLLSVTGRGKFYSAGTDLSDPAKLFVSARRLSPTTVHLRRSLCRRRRRPRISTRSSRKAPLV